MNHGRHRQRADVAPLRTTLVLHHRDQCRMLCTPTLRRWRAAFLAYFTTGRSSNGGTEAANGIIQLHRRLARAYRDRHNHRLRMLLAAGGDPYRMSEEPLSCQVAILSRMSQPKSQSPSLRRRSAGLGPLGAPQGSQREPHPPMYVGGVSVVPHRRDGAPKHRSSSLNVRQKRLVQGPK